MNSILKYVLVNATKTIKVAFIFFYNRISYYLTFPWDFGFLANSCLIIQIISGVYLSMFYLPHIDSAFSSVEYIMRDVKNGWLIRYIHSNGSSMFFLLIYGHMFQGIYYGSYMGPRKAIWCSGVVIFLLALGTAFTGHVLPWSQMSFWGATVITNIVVPIPFVGEPIVEFIWGGFTLGNFTLIRFYSIHYVLPFLITGLTLIHLALFHKVGSSSPIGSDTELDDPYFFYTNVFALCVFLLVFATFVFYFPNTLNHPDNYVPADYAHPPAYVVPQWYFSPYYAICRSIPHEAFRIMAMGGSIAVLFLIPFINTSYVRNTTYRPIFKIFFWIFVIDFIILTWVGQKPATNTFILMGQIATVYYFLFFIFLIPIIGIIETYYKIEE